MVRSKGYTIIEVLVTVLVLAILISIVTLGISSYQAKSFDAERQADTAVIAEALERYYDNNGEYPGCTALSSDAETVTSDVIKGINIESLRSPTESDGTGNSLRCAEIEEIDSSSYILTADPGDSCQNGPACFEWKLSYQKQSDGQVVTIDSRHTRDTATQHYGIVISARAEGTDQISLSWDEITGASYVVERASNAAFTSGKVTSTTLVPSIVQSGLTPGATYYFRARVQVMAGLGSWSNVANATTDMPTTSVAMSSAMSGSTARGTVSGSSCPAGSYVQYGFRTRGTGTATEGSWSGWSTWSTSSTYDIDSTSQGFKYSFQAQARCINSTTGAISETTLSNVSNVVRGIEAPTAPILVLAVASNKDSGVWSWGSTCPSGTSASYNTAYYRNDATGWRAWSGDTTATSYTLATNYQGYTYQVRVRERCGTVHATSAYSANSNAPSHTRAINAPTISLIGYNDTVTSYSWTTNNLGASSYTVQRSAVSSFSPVISTHTATTGSSYSSGLTPGTTYYYRVRAVNTVTGAVSPWSNTLSRETTWIKSNNLLGSLWSFEGCGTYPTGCSGWGNGDGAHPANRMAYSNPSIARHGSAYMDNTRQAAYYNNSAQLGGSLARSISFNMYNKTITGSVWARMNTGSKPVTFTIRSANTADAGGGAELAGTTQTVTTQWTLLTFTAKYTNSAYNKYLKFEVYLPQGSDHLFLDGAQAFEGTWNK